VKFRKGLITLAGVMALAVPGIAAASASTTLASHTHSKAVASTVRPNVTRWAECDWKAIPPNKCIEDDGPFADFLNENFAGHVASQHMDFFFHSTACGGGHVTSTCPFDVGSGNNTAFLGDEIDTLENVSTGNCAQATNPGGAVRDSGGGCSGTSGTDWVHDGSWSFIGVYATNHQSNDNPEYLTGGNAGTTVKVHDGFVNGYSQWGNES
jgi:hypothetical protein